MTIVVTGRHRSAVEGARDRPRDHVCDVRILEPADHVGQQLGERHRAFASRDRSTFAASSGPRRICARLRHLSVGVPRMPVTDPGLGQGADLVTHRGSDGHSLTGGHRTKRLELPLERRRRRIACTKHAATLPPPTPPTHSLEVRPQREHALRRSRDVGGDGVSGHGHHAYCITRCRPSVRTASSRIHSDRRRATPGSDERRPKGQRMEESP